MARRPKQFLADAPEKVYGAAIKRLSKRDHSVGEMRDYLLSRGADADVAEETIRRLLESGYLDDARFAAGRIRHRLELSGHSRSAVRAELRWLHVDAEVVESTMQEGYSEADELALAKKLAWRILSADPAAPERRKKAERRLFSRGFRPDVVRRVFSELAEYDPEAEWQLYFEE